MAPVDNAKGSMMHARIATVLAAGLAFGAGEVSAVVPVLPIGDPVPIVWFRTLPETRFFHVDASGRVYGSVTDDFVTHPPLIVDETGTQEVTNWDGGELGGFNPLSDDGRIGIASDFRFFDSEACRPDRYGWGRDFLFDIERGEAVFFDPDCPRFFPQDLGQDGRIISGTFAQDSSLLTPNDAAAFWEDGQITVLPMIEIPAPYTGDTESTAMALSIDATRFAGFVGLEAEGDLPPFRRALVWTQNEAVELLPSEDFLDASSAYSISLDGESIIGSSWRWEERSLSGGSAAYWAYTEKERWWLDGTEMIVLESGDGEYDWQPRDFFAGGTLIYGQTSWETDRVGLVWDRSGDAQRGDDYLESLGVDLDGREVLAFIDVSDNNHWMLVTLRIDDDNEQYTRISIPCSPADITADRAVAMDDLAAYADRFLSGNPLADLTGDGVLDLADIVEYIALFQAGCVG